MNPRIDRAVLVVGYFVASEFVFFAMLILAYVLFQRNVSTGPTAADNLHPATMAIYSVFLLASSPTMWIANRRLQADDARGFRLWTLLSVALGVVFLAGETLEYSGLNGKGIDLSSNLFGTTFFTLTGFHALHVFIGIVMLSILAALTLRVDRRRKSAAEAVGLYWHFVDTMWIFIFSTVYLWSASR
jgi:heme/copper-type cytochrome/quinol oxidase subunit 3